jgi:hypothetical protein
MVQATVKLNSGNTADIWTRRFDPSTGYLMRLDSANVTLNKFVNGKLTQIASSVAVKIRLLPSNDPGG